MAPKSATTLGVVVFSNRLHFDQRSPDAPVAEALTHAKDSTEWDREEVSYVQADDAMRTIYAAPFSLVDEAKCAGFVEFLGAVYEWTERDSETIERRRSSLKVHHHKRERRKSKQDLQENNLGKWLSTVEWASQASDLLSAEDHFASSLGSRPSRDAAPSASAAPRLADLTQARRPAPTRPPSDARLRRAFDRWRRRV